MDTPTPKPFNERVRYIGVYVGHLKSALSTTEALVIEIDRFDDPSAPWQGQVVATIPDRSGMNAQRVAAAIEAERRAVQ